MMSLSLAPERDRPLRVLCVGAHSDDIEIGCGGTMLSLLEAMPTTEVHWVVFCAHGEREAEARAGAAFFLKSAGSVRLSVESFRDGFLPFDGARVKDFFEEMKLLFTPDLVFTHYRHDRHQDHRTVSDLTWNTYRNQLILEYEIPKWDGDLGNPNAYMPLSEQVVEEKVAAILRIFGSQQGKHWLTEDTLQGLLRLRGIEIGSGERFAEGFYSRKAVLRALMP